MPTEEILKTYSVVELKREIGKARIKGYSKLKKAEVVSLMMKNKEKFHHLKGKGKAPKATGGAKPAPKPKAKPAPKPKAVAKPAKKEPAHLPKNVMDNIKGFMNVGKDAKDFKDTVYEYTIGGDGLRGPKKRTTYYLRASKEIEEYRIADAYYEITTGKPARGNKEHLAFATAARNKFAKKINNDRIYLIKTVLPVLRQKDAEKIYISAHPNWMFDEPFWKREESMTKDLNNLFLRDMGTTRRPTAKGLRFIKITS
jgi:hypothetical protein